MSKLLDINENLIITSKIIVSNLTCRNIYFYNRCDEKSYLKVNTLYL